MCVLTPPHAAPAAWHHDPRATMFARAQLHPSSDDKWSLNLFTSKCVDKLCFEVLETYGARLKPVPIKTASGATENFLMMGMRGIMKLMFDDLSTEFMLDFNARVEGEARGADDRVYSCMQTADWYIGLGQGASRHGAGGPLHLRRRYGAVINGREVPPPAGAQRAPPAGGETQAREHPHHRLQADPAPQT